ncbi:MAG: helix-turn-helix domain-containing protein [Nocardioidaceae bacterium]
MARIIPLQAAESGRDDNPGGHLMPIGERIKQLRKEAGWSQGELAERVDTDARQISRYENGRITPGLDVLARIAQTLDISLDHLVFDDIPRRRLHANENALGDRLAAITELTDDELAVLRSVIDGLLAKSRLRTLTADIS